MANELNPKRRRGTVLTEIGREKLRVARDLWARQHYGGNRLTNEELSEIVQISPNTLTKIRYDRAVDRASLARCFTALGTVLTRADWEYQSMAAVVVPSLESESLFTDNPSNLNILTTTLRQLVDGDIERFVVAERSLFDEICQLVDRQFVREASAVQHRPSERELLVMYWLALDRLCRQISKIA
jgi:hypothetical protein